MQETIVAFLVIDEDGHENLGMISQDDLVVPMLAQDEARTDTLRRYATLNAQELDVCFLVKEYELRHTETIGYPNLNPNAIAN